MASVLEQLGEKHEPSKRIHNYLPAYARYLEPIRETATRVMEIGVQSGKSLTMWEEYFPNATLVGLDIDPKCKEIEGGRRKIAIGDQGDETFISSVCEEYGPFDVVIDDGSHFAHHMMCGFNWIAPHMKQDAFYIIEDTGGITGCQEVVNAFKGLADGINYWPDNAPSRFWPYMGALDTDDFLTRRVVSVAFHRWMIVVEFGSNPERNTYLKHPSELTPEVAQKTLTDWSVPEPEATKTMDSVRNGFFSKFANGAGPAADQNLAFRPLVMKTPDTVQETDFVTRLKNAIKRRLG